MIWGLLIYVFNFWNFRGSFWSLIFGFWKFLKCILNQNYHFWGGVFYKTFLFEASSYMFSIFCNFWGCFWVKFLVFENFEIVFWIRIPTLGGLFYKTFWFEASLYMFLIFWNFRGSFLSLFFGFWKSWNCFMGVCIMKLFDLRLLRWFYWQ